MQYIFLFSLGPVQSFIAQARKTQDLYAGSRLLSTLCFEAIKTARGFGIEIVIPAIPIDKEPTSMPNRMVGTIETNLSNDKIWEIGDKIEKAVQARFKEITQEVLNEQRVSFTWNIAKEQIEKHLEIHWLFHKIETSYHEDYQQAEKLFGATKNFRPFKQLKETGRKCSLDGERNVKFYKPTEKDKNISWLLKYKLFMLQNEVFVDETKNDRTKTPLSILQNGEGLSAVSFVKRGYKHESFQFPSTANIALRQTLFNLICDQTGKGLRLISDYRNCFEPFDEQLYYPENQTSSYLEKYGFKADYGYEKKYEALAKYAKENKWAFQKYYALIAFDGDKMGKIMNGYYLKEESKERLKDFQHRVSELLFGFAEEAKKYLTDPKGRAVYAGGDDFLGFINLNHLYPVLAELQKKFNCSVNKIIKEEFSDDLDLENFDFTFSAGVVIAHYKTPLSIVVQKAREMEHIAKNKGGRNAFAIAAIKHSGESHHAYFKWKYLPHLETIHEQLKENFSNTFIDSLQREFALLWTKTDNKTDSFLHDNDSEGYKIIDFEIKRLVNNSFMKHDLPSEIKKELRIKLSQSVKTLFDESENFENFSQTLNITEFTQRLSQEV